MALVTVLIRKSVVAVHVTLGARQRDMRACERELCARMCKRRRLPCRLRVTYRAVVAETSSGMVGIESCVECA